MNFGRVLVVGAGIGGLAAAAALRHASSRVVVVERAPEFGAVGAGIVLAANAVLALRALGIDPVPHGRTIRSMILRSAAGTPLSTAHPAEISPEGPTVGLHRAALHELLLTAAGLGADLRPGRTIARLEADAGGADVSFDDGSSERFDHVIAADGLHSGVRERLGGPRPVYSGYTCWRAVVDEPGRQDAVEWWGRGRRFGAVPIAGDRTYVFFTRNAPERGSADVEDFASMFRDFEPEVRDLVERIDPAKVLHHDLSALDGAFWGSGRVWLLGDAAHATLPNEGQGAAMAIEDALALRIAALEGDSAAAFARWVGLRDARVRKIQRDSRRFGQIGQWESGWATGLRDWVVARTPARVAARQVRAVVAPGIALVAAAR